jgi:hypothetical protein
MTFGPNPVLTALVASLAGVMGMGGLAPAMA